MSKLSVGKNKALQSHLGGVGQSVLARRGIISSFFSSEMYSFRPITSRTVFAVVTASAVGSGCYAWMAKSGRTPVTVNKSAATGVGTTSHAFGLVSPHRTVSCQPVQTTSNPAEEPSADGSKPESLRPLVVCGPSGVGKGTLINMLLQEYPGRFGFSVSHTTRAPRPGEEHGKHYFFSDKTVMQMDIDEDKFIEHANVHGNLYGTSFAAVQSVTASGKVCILDIDVQGVRSVQRAGTSMLDPHYLFISAPSLEVLEARLRGRGSETEDALQRRMANSRAEMEFGTEPGNFEKVLVNDALEEAYTKLRQTAQTWYPQLLGETDEAATKPSAP